MVMRLKQRHPNPEYRRASDAQQAYVVSLATRVWAHPEHPRYTPNFLERREYARQFAREMSTAQASRAIEALKALLAEQAA